MGDWPVTDQHYTEVSRAEINYVLDTIRGVPVFPPCRVYWGSHGCMHPRGHGADVPHECDCCTCGVHPDPGSGCVGRPPYYGEKTRYYGEDAEALGLPLVNAPDVTEE